MASTTQHSHTSSHPVRSGDSIIFNTPARELTITKPRFMWTADHNEVFEAYIYQGKTTYESFYALLEELDLDGYQNVTTEAGLNVQVLITKKVLAKLQRNGLPLPSRDFIEAAMVAAEIVVTHSPSGGSSSDSSASTQGEEASPQRSLPSSTATTVPGAPLLKIPNQAHPTRQASPDSEASGNGGLRLSPGDWEELVESDECSLHEDIKHVIDCFIDLQRAMAAMEDAVEGVRFLDLQAAVAEALGKIDGMNDILCRDV